SFMTGTLERSRPRRKSKIAHVFANAKKGVVQTRPIWAKTPPFSPPRNAMSALQGTYGRGAPSVEVFWRQRMRGYRKRIEQDLPRWRESGWVTAEGEKAIAAEVAQSGWQISLAPALAILGAVLFGFAVMSFVAANWQEMPKLLRIVLLLGGLLVSYLAAGALFQRGLDAFAHAAILIGVAIFGASIMLIS